MAEVRAGINTPQHRDLRRRPGARRRQLPAAHAGPARRRRPRAARGEARRGHLPQDRPRASARSTRPHRGRASSWRSRTCPRSGRSPTRPAAAGSSRLRPLPTSRAWWRRSATGERFPVRRIELAEPLDDFFFDPGYAQPDRRQPRRRQGGRGQSRRPAAPIAELPLPGLPHLGSGIGWSWQGRRVMATPHLKEAAAQRDRHCRAGSWSSASPRSGPASSCAATRPAPTPGSTSCWAPRARTRCRSSTSARSRSCARSSPPRARPRPMSSSPATAATPSSQRLGERRRAGRLRRRHLRGGQAPADAQAVGKYNVWNKITFEEGTSH